MNDHWDTFMELDYQIFAAFLAVWVVLAVQFNAGELEAWKFILLLPYLGFLAMWLKIIIITGASILRLFFHLTAFFLSFVPPFMILYQCYTCYSTAEKILVQFLLPSVVAYWLIASELNRINMRLIFQDTYAFYDQGN